MVLGASGAIAGTAASWGLHSRGRSGVSAKPLLYRSADGLLELDLIARENPIDLAGKTIYPLTYNGQIPGSRLEARGGDRIRIHLTNSLNTSTNLHLHTNSF